jgi:transposase-like protein
MNTFAEPYFHNEEAARAMLEGIRWPNGLVCAHCGAIGGAYNTGRPGRYRCGSKECRKDFSIITGTVMESSHIKLTKWLMGFYMMSASKKGVSAHQFHRALGVTYKSAWFMAHRIRHAMSVGGLTAPIGGEGKIVEADETYFGKKEIPGARKTKRYDPPTKKGRSGPGGKRAIVALVERGGSARTFHVAVADKETVQKIVRENVAPESRLHTDESNLYGGIDAHVRVHETVKHSVGEYAREGVHCNSAEGYFGVFKRGMRGVYQHCAEKHLHRYLAEFDFRYNNRTKLGVDDMTRTQTAIKQAEGKRLTYRKPDSNSLFAAR